MQDGRAGLPEWMIGDGFWGKWHLSITAEEKREKHSQQERDMCKSQGAVPEILREQGGEHNGQWGGDWHEVRARGEQGPVMLAG